MKPRTPPDPNTSSGEVPAGANPTASTTQAQPSGSGRANGKIARLPKTVRDQINEWISDGVSYPQIITRLGPSGADLNPGHFSEWKKRGHQDWLVEQAFIARTRARQETSEDLVRDFDATQVNHAALQLGTLHIFEAFRDLGPGTLNQKLGGDTAAFARLLNALARTSRETLLLQKYREACAKARAALQALRDPKRKLSQDENRSLVLMVDDILGMPSDDDLPETQPHQVRTESPLSSVTLLAKEDSSLTSETPEPAATPAIAPLSALGGEG